MKCKYCIFFRDSECHHDPPVFTGLNKCLFTWPPVNDDNWCGKFSVIEECKSCKYADDKNECTAKFAIDKIESLGRCCWWRYKFEESK